MQLLPGFSSKPLRAPDPLPPPPERDDPAVVDRKKKLRLSTVRRRGRAASIVNRGGGQGDLGEAPVNRPEARAARNFGG